ncbi:MAG: glycine cleavage system aminomethyltransferase GcvT [Chitinispirillales bacterium]|nr:glycine cleavage system aminomethyltransferase GcvT [Chitinispirillales bacterium]
MKTTVLHSVHASLGAKMSPFGGYDMPIQYAGGIIAEHNAARSGAALFDTCHMGEFMLSGPSAAVDLDRLLSNDVANLAVGACRYGFLCNDGGGVIDDLITYRIAETEFMVVVNASGEDGDFNWIKERVSKDTTVENLSHATAKIDLQGPKSPKIAASLLKHPLNGLKYYRFMQNRYKDADIILSRTGYTGEIGFEIYCPAGIAAGFWNDCMNSGAVPAGLGARDILRLEMGYPLYGHELSADRNAAQSGFSHAISKNKPFIGSAKVLDSSLSNQSLTGISLDGRRTVHCGDTVMMDGKSVGTVTSGCFSPTQGRAIALAYIDKESVSIDKAVSVISGKNELTGKIAETPFYKKGTVRGDINLYL